MKSSQGYCHAYRKAWYHPAFNNLREAAIWNFLYQNAFYEDGESNINGYTFQLKRGQIAISTSYLAKGFAMSDKGVRVVIQKLIKLGMVGVQGTSRGSIITICNYDAFQKKVKAEGELKGNNGANKGQAKGNNNNEDNKINEVKEEKKEGKNFVLPLPEWLPLDDWNHYLQSRKKKASNYAKQLLIIKLEELRGKGNDPGKVLRQSTMNGWTSLIEIKERNNANTATGYGNIYPNSNQGASFNDKHQRTLEAAARGHARAQNPDF